MSEKQNSTDLKQSLDYQLLSANIKTGKFRGAHFRWIASDYSSTFLHAVVCLCILFVTFVYSVLWRLNLLFRYYVFVCILLRKAASEMTYIVSGGTLNPTHSFTHFFTDSNAIWQVVQVHLWGPVTHLVRTVSVEDLDRNRPAKTGVYIQLTKKNDLSFTSRQHRSAVPPFTKLNWFCVAVFFRLWLR